MRAAGQGLAVALVAAATLACGVPPAGAGTYTVASCGAPGGGGVNKAWLPEASGFDNGSVSVPPDPGSYVIADQCPGQLLVESNPAGGTARFLTGGNWVFDPPAGTRITQLDTWRYGFKYRTSPSDPDPSHEGDQGDPWEVFARDENASVIGGVFGDTCQIPAGSNVCTFGADAGISSASRRTYPINVARISYSVSCEELYGGCPRNGVAGGPAAAIKIFGTRVTITDSSAPRLAVGGPLLKAGWRKPGEVLTYDASDSSGIRSVRLDMGGRTRRDVASCDYRRPAPCTPRRARVLRIPDGTPDGTYDSRIVAQDASGNETPRPRSISIDGTPPGAVLERARGKSVVLSLSDNASGVAGATLEVRRHSTEPYRTVNATVTSTRLRARIAEGKASKLDMRVTVRDNAGNVVQGNPTRLKVTSAKVGRHSRRIRSGRVKIPFGRKARLRGRLTLSAGQSFGRRTIVAASTVLKRGAKPKPAGTAVTDRHGRFSLKVPAGPSRRYRLVFPGVGGALGAARGMSVRVPASSTIHASRTLLAGGRVRFSGRVRSRGQRIPGRGLVLVLQGRERGDWRTFADTRTNGKGRWHVAYSFSGRPGPYPIRVRIRRQARFPFELGYSRALTIRVG